MSQRVSVIPTVSIASIALLIAVMARWDALPAYAQAAGACATGAAVSDPANNPGLVSDCEMLLTARDTLAGTATLNWSADTPIADWAGVTVDGTPARVMSLDLSSNRLSGSIPSELGSLSKLTYLSLHDNELSGSIPSELGSLSNLTSLYLSGNELSGPIPSSLGNLSNLTSLHLSGNQLSGCVPAALRDVASNDFDQLGLPFCAETLLERYDENDDGVIDSD